MNIEHKTALLAITENGFRLAGILADRLEGKIFFCRGSLQETLKTIWPCYRRLVFIMSTGIVVRLLTPLLTDKYKDPGVVVCDELGNFAISLLSGHIGGANKLAEEIAHITGGSAVITTASDVTGHTAVDLWARKLGLTPQNRREMTRVMGRLVANGSLSLFSDYALENIPDDFRLVAAPQQADLIITPATDLCCNGLILTPKSLVAGIGCNRGTPADHIEQALQATCSRNHLAVTAIRNLASIDVKNNEPGLLAFARSNGYTIDFFHHDQLNAVPDVSSSAAVLKAVGVKGVAEPAALLSAHATILRVRKEKWTDVTVAIAEVPWP